MFVDNTNNIIKQFVIEQNHSLSWYGNVIFFLSLASLSFAIASVFAWLELWMILLASILYFCWHKTQSKQTINITNDQVTINTEHKKPEHSCTFHRPWIHVVFSAAIVTNHQRKLWIRSHGHQVEIGLGLNNKEKSLLAIELDRTINMNLSAIATSTS